MEWGLGGAEGEEGGDWESLRRGFGEAGAGSTWTMQVLSGLGGAQGVPGWVGPEYLGRG